MKKALCAALALCLCLALAACGGGDAPDPASATDLSPAPATPTPAPQPVATLFVSGIPMVVDGQLTAIACKGASYADGVLTFAEGFALDGDTAGYPCVQFTGDLVIELSGACALESSEGLPAIQGGEAGDAAPSSLTVRGGALSLRATGAAALRLTGTLTLDGAALDAEGEPAAVYDALELDGGSAVTEESEARLVVASEAR